MAYSPGECAAGHSLLPDNMGFIGHTHFAPLDERVQLLEHSHHTLV